MSEIKLKITHLSPLGHEQYNVLNMLYAPLLSANALKLYMLIETLIMQQTTIRNYRFLYQTLKISLNEVIAARIELEQFNLVETYENSEKNQHLIRLLPPKSGRDFLSHDLFGLLYQKEMGQKMYEFVQLSFLPKEIDESYTEISEAFDSSAFISWGEEEEEMFKKLLPKEEKRMKITFDTVAFLNDCSTLVFPRKERKAENVKLIEEMGTIYGISIKDMKKIVSKSINLTTKTFNQSEFKYRVRSIFEPAKEFEDVYELPPVKFLEYKQKGIPVTSPDKKLLEDLTMKYKLDSRVTNVLVEYVLETRNQSLERSYVEKIAGKLIRSNAVYDSVNDIIHDKEKQPVKKVSVKKPKADKMIPQWYLEKDEQKEEVALNNDEEIAAFKKMLEDLG